MRFKCSTWENNLACPRNDIELNPPKSQEKRNFNAYKKL